MSVTQILPLDDNHAAVSDLYERLLQAWNERDAFLFSSQFCEHGTAIGFDGSQMTGKQDINAQLDKIFKDHSTATYVWKIWELRSLSKAVVILRAAAGMVPPGKTEINPARNSIQSLVASHSSEGWKIELFQNTPAVFDGRPVLGMELKNELQGVLSATL